MRVCIQTDWDTVSILKLMRSGDEYVMSERQGLILPKKQLAVNNALTQVLDFCSQSNLEVKIFQHDNKYGVTSCLLFENGRCDHEYSGAGKGINREESILDSLLCSLKVYFLKNYMKYLNMEIANTAKCMVSDIIDDIPFNLLDKKADLAVLRYMSTRDEDAVNLPLALSCPFYVTRNFRGALKYDTCDYTFFNKYISPNGLSVQFSSDEAIIQSIFENIADRSLGDFLVNVIGLNQFEHCKILDKKTIPSFIVKMVAYAEAETGREIILIDLTNEIGIPVFMSYINSSNRIERQFSLGCSLSSVEALQNSVLGILQLKIYSDNNDFNFDLIVKENNKYMSYFEKDNYYNRFSFLRIGEYINNIRKFHEFRETDETFVSVERKKECLLEKLGNKNLKFYYTSFLNNSEVEISCIHGVILPYSYTHLLSKSIKITLTLKDIKLLDA